MGPLRSKRNKSHTLIPNVLHLCYFLFLSHVEINNDMIYTYLVHNKDMHCIFGNCIINYTKQSIPHLEPITDNV